MINVRRSYLISRTSWRFCFPTYYSSHRTMRVVKKIGSRVLGILSRVFGRPTGWKQAATVNCILLCIISIILIGLLITTAIQAGGIEDPVLFYEGSCKQKSASYLNFFLHLLINIVSTLVYVSLHAMAQTRPGQTC